MLRTTLAVLAVALPLSLRTAAAGDDAKAQAEKLLTAGAKMFEAKDAKGLAATYTGDAAITAVTREKDSGKLKTEVTRGRADIEKTYGDMFKGDATFHAKNTIEYARWAGPDILVVAGHFEPDTQSSEPIKVPFVQVRVKEGDAWKIANLQLFILLEK
jgi:ketosteroid isomerase-like protein